MVEEVGDQPLVVARKEVPEEDNSKQATFNLAIETW